MGEERGGVIVSTIHFFLRVWSWVAYRICICLQKQNHLCSRYGWSEGRMDLASPWWTSFQSKWAELTSVSFHFHIFCSITTVISSLFCFTLDGTLFLSLFFVWFSLHMFNFCKKIWLQQNPHWKQFNVGSYIMPYLESLRSQEASKWVLAIYLWKL